MFNRHMADNNTTATNSTFTNKFLTRKVQMWIQCGSRVQ